MVASPLPGIFFGALDYLGGERNFDHVFAGDELVVEFGEHVAQFGCTSDVIVGTPVSRRGPADLDQVIAYLSDILPVRLTADLNESFARGSWQPTPLADRQFGLQPFSQQPRAPALIAAQAAGSVRGAGDRVKLRQSGTRQLVHGSPAARREVGEQILAHRNPEERRHQRVQLRQTADVVVRGPADGSGINWRLSAGLWDVCQVTSRLPPSAGASGAGLDCRTGGPVIFPSRVPRTARTPGMTSSGRTLDLDSAALAASTAMSIAGLSSSARGRRYEVACRAIASRTLFGRMSVHVSSM